MSQVFIGWIEQQRRAESMRDYFGFDLHFVTSRFRQQWTKPLDYAAKFGRTWSILSNARPDVVWVQSPPTPAVHETLLFRQRWPETRVIVDCHNGAFQSPWSKVPFARSAHCSADLVVVHNEDVVAGALALGVQPERILVLEDAVANVVVSGPRPPEVEEILERGAVILAPCSWSSDEPIETIFDAARQSPDLVFVVTGCPRKSSQVAIAATAPANVMLCGFLDREAFDHLLIAATAVLGLTTDEGVQLSVAGEAIGAGTPLVLSDTHTLRRMFGTGSVFVETLSAQSISKGCRDAAARAPELRKEIGSLRITREALWNVQAERMSEWLGDA